MPDLTIKVTTTGSAGSATGSAQSGFDLPSGSVIDAIGINYNGAAPATTDVTIAEAEGLAQTLLTVTDNATDGTYYPRHALHDTTGVDSGQIGIFAVEGPISVSVAGCDALTNAVEITIRYLHNRNLN